jgi:putative tricarboxylic transport membrane protein
MAERSFLAVVALIAAGYAALAALTIRAPIQYDPLGPETWPLILGLLLLVTALIRLVRPVGTAVELTRHAGLRLLVATGLLLLYAVAFQRVGFTLSTWAFCAGLTLMLGARPWSALIFGAGAAASIYMLFTYLLDLRLPAGPLGGVI